jgi:hypothetical protein
MDCFAIAFLKCIDLPWHRNETRHVDAARYKKLIAELVPVHDFVYSITAVCGVNHLKYPLKATFSIPFRRALVVVLRALPH